MTQGILAKEIFDKPSIGLIQTVFNTIEMGRFKGAGIVAKNGKRVKLK